MEEVVLESLFSGETETQIQAAMDLNKLSSLQKHRFAENGGVTCLLLMLFSEDHRAIEASLFAILSLAFRSERNKIRIVRSGAVPLLLKLLRCEIRALIDLAMAAIMILSSCSSNKPAIAASGTIQILLEILSAKTQGLSIQAKLDAISSLHNLSTCNDDAVSLLVSCGLVPSLLTLIAGSEKSSDLAEKAAALLDHAVSSSEAALRESAAAEGHEGVRALVEAVEEGTVACKEHAAAVLLAVCRSCRERYRGVILGEGAVPGLLRLRVDGTRRGREIAGELLSNLREYSDSKSSRRRRRGLKGNMVEMIMEEIETGVVRVGSTLRLVEEVISKLSS